jgi:flagellar motor switch protein FliM
VTDRRTPRARVFAPGAVDARPYDFESPELLSDAARERLDLAFEAFARQAGLQITAKTRSVVDLEYRGFVALPHGLFAAQDDEPCCFLLAAMDDEPSRIVYRVPADEARFWASRMVGGSGAPAGGQRLTAVERALVWRMAEDHVDELHLALKGLLPEAVVESFAYDLSADRTAPDELMLCAAFGVQRRDGDAVVAVALPAQPVLDRIGAGADPQTADTVAELLAAHVAEAPVTVSVAFDPTLVGPATVLGLAEGDLIPLTHPQHRPLTVALDGTPVVRAAVGGSGDRLACVVVDS